MGQLSSCAATTEAHEPRTCAPKQEKPPQWDTWAPQLESNPCSMQLEKACAHQWRARELQQRPSTAKDNSKDNIFIKKESFLNVISKYWSPVWGSRGRFLIKNIPLVHTAKRQRSLDFSRSAPLGVGKVGGERATPGEAGAQNRSPSCWGLGVTPDLSLFAN